MQIEFPDWSDNPHREIKYDPQFLEDRERYKAAHPLFLEIMDWFEWLVSRRPDNRYATRHPEPYDDYYEMSSGDMPPFGPPDVVVIYYFDESSVTLWGMFIDEDE